MLFRRNNTESADSASSQKPLWKRILLNKYLIASTIFLVFFIFLDTTNLVVTLRLRHKVRTLHQQEERLRQEISDDSIRVGQLVGNLEELERFGREEYYMKRADEDIYVINNDEEE